ncbi:MAG TPA: helix-turn-helix transcriptional regulator [Candidatus Binatia bacterium]|nr:helix-turn-helix transcriptional regulator [Candidatus Binatia bacterium]
MLSYLERGLRIPNLDALLRVTEALHVDLADILNRGAESTSKVIVSPTYVACFVHVAG